MFRRKIERKHKQRARNLSTQKATTNTNKTLAESSNPLTPTDKRAGSNFAKTLPALLYTIDRKTPLSKTSDASKITLTLCQDSTTLFTAIPITLITKHIIPCLYKLFLHRRKQV